jgi:hypothetical protein
MLISIVAVFSGMEDFTPALPSQETGTVNSLK